MSGPGVHRIEAFSDAVFAFALTLLVVSLEVPDTFDDLLATIRGFIPFAASFAIVAWLWYEHGVFFRRFALDDRFTILVNCVLLFVVLFYVYPLKFVFTLVFQQFGVGGARPVSAHATDARALMAIYSSGFIAIFGCLSLLYWHAWRKRRTLQLDALDVYDARSAMISHLLSIAVGVFSLIFTWLLPGNMAGLSGYLYVLLGPVHAVWGKRTGRDRKRLEAQTVVT